MRQSLAIWLWLVWYSLCWLGWSWILGNSPVLASHTQLHKHFIGSSQWYYKAGTLFCQWGKKKQPGRVNTSSLFISQLITVEPWLQPSIKSQDSWPSQHWNKVIGSRNHTAWPRAGGSGILLKEESINGDWQSSSVLRDSVEGGYDFNTTRHLFVPKDPQTLIFGSLGLQSSDFQSWTLWEVSRSWWLRPCHTSTCVQLVAHRP